MARHRHISLRDAPALPSGDAPVRATAMVYLLRPEDFVHPALRAQAAARGAVEGPWAVVPASGWQGMKRFPTAKAARSALAAAGFKGPVGKGTSSRWTR